MENTHHQLTITGIAHNGAGIGRLDTLVVFVPGALLGEIIMVRLSERKKNLAQGEIIEIITSSPDRIAPPCAQAGICGGCDFQHATYTYQLQAKNQIVTDAITRIGRSDAPIAPTIGATDPWRYRNKGYFHVDYSGGGVRIGFYQEKSKTLVQAKDCLLFSQTINHLISFLEDLILHSGHAHYIDHILIRESFYNGALMLIFVGRDKAWRHPEWIPVICDHTPHVTSIYYNTNTNPRLMLGAGFAHLHGTRDLLDTIGEITFRLSPQSFFQVHNAQAHRLYQAVLDAAALQGNETVIDAYCGIGTISLYLAGQAAHVYGVESIGQAILDAKANAQANKITNAEFITAKAEQWLPKWLDGGHTADLIVLDPPRKGCDSKLLAALANSNIPRIIYVSCNPATLARDLRTLQEEGGYTIAHIQPVDMFCGTAHVECCVSLVKE